MSEWKKVKLKDCCISISDGDHLPPPKSNCGIPFITISNIDSTNHIDFGNTLFVPIDYYDRLDSIRKPQKDDILYSVVGSFGKPVLIKENKNFVFQRHIAILRPNNEIADSRFLYYVMLTRDFYMQADSVAIGAAQRTVSLTSLRNMTVELPCLSTQYRIATILSRYDTLIENYQKQIKLLEEAAQRLYKEWFVELRFPGYENIKIVDGLPEGWERKKLGELVEFKRGKTITKKEAIEGNIPVVAGGLEPAYYCDKSNTTDRVITISGSGANAGFTKMYFEKVWASDCSYADTSATQYLHFVFCFLRENKTVIDNMQKGAAQPHVYAKDINSLEALLPTKEILNSFEIKASKTFDNIASLQTQIRLLTEARDRLLPRLMGGEMEVDGLKGQRANSPEHRSGRNEENEQMTNAPKGQKH